VLLLWALRLFLLHRRADTKTMATAGPQSGSQTTPENPEAEAVRGYFREREKLFDMWDAHERNRDPKK
jgi:hypothetical protein